MALYITAENIRACLATSHRFAELGDAKLAADYRARYYALCKQAPMSEITRLLEVLTADQPAQPDVAA